jgi:hypothetical protein
MSGQIPPQVAKYFWGDDLQKLSWPAHQAYITQTILEKGDLPAVKWLLQQSNRDEIKRQLPKFKLSPKSANFWRVYL